jgi:DUF1680 family protein
MTLQFDMTPRITAANPKVEGDSRRVAIEHGPLAYCMERIDQPDSAGLDGFSLPLNEKTGTRIEAALDSSLLGGIVAPRAPGLELDAAQPSGSRQLLYRTMDVTATKPFSLKLIPYYTFANREPSAMQVWIPYVRRNRWSSRSL